MHLLIVSNSGSQSYLEKVCQREGILEHVTVVGPIQRSRIREYYEKIDVIVIPRLGDSRMARLVTPLKPLEAMALGIPLIISDTPATKELVGEENATFFEPGDTSELFEKLCFFIGDESEAGIRVENGIRWIKERGTWEISASNSLTEYNSILDS